MKISATLEEPVLRQIREHTSNVSGFLNEAAKRRLYFELLDTTIRELEQAGLERNLRFYRNLRRWTRQVDSRRRREIERTARKTAPR